ncbi:unnamed protein product [Musa acuminata var. zebrina]
MRAILLQTLRHFQMLMLSFLPQTDKKRQDFCSCQISSTSSLHQITDTSKFPRSS